MSRWWRTNACERATQWISLDLDGELSQLEQAGLHRHLADRAACRAARRARGRAPRRGGGAVPPVVPQGPLVELEREVAYAAPRRTRVRVVRRAAGSLAFA